MGFLNATEAEFDALYRIHVKSVFFLSQKLLPLLADGGRIVNVSSGLTRIVMANRAPYAIMKSAVETLTRYMAFELGVADHGELRGARRHRHRFQRGGGITRRSLRR